MNAKSPLSQRASFIRWADLEGGRERTPLASRASATETLLRQLRPPETDRECVVYTLLSYCCRLQTSPRKFAQLGASRLVGERIAA